MSTKATALKTWKPKTNKYVGILDQFLEKYNLSANSTSEYQANMLLNLVLDSDYTLPKKKIHKAKKKSGNKKVKPSSFWNILC